MDALSNDEFHRLQLQILELRTENYQLKDENKKLSTNLTTATNDTARLEREVNKQTKLRKAFTTLNKSKQAAEFEELLQQNEQAFILQNQTLAEELSKLQMSVKILENENRQFKRQISLAPQDKAKEAEFRKLQATNAALRQSLTALREDHKVNTKNTKDKTDAEVGKSDMQDYEDEKSAKLNGTGSCSGEESPNGEVSAAKNKALVTANSEDESKYADLEVQLLTLQEEKRLLEFELDNAKKTHDAKITEISDAMSALQTKLDQKQKSYNNIQKEMSELQTLKKKAIESSDSMTLEIQELKSKLEVAATDSESLHKALQESHNILEQQQKSLLHWQQQVDLKEEDYRVIKTEHTEKTERLESTTKELEKCSSKLKALQKERDDLQARFEKTANVGEALLDKHTELEKKCEQLQHELQQALNLAEKRKVMLENTKQYEVQIEKLKTDLQQSQELAEKRKETANSQSIQAQEMMAKLNEQTTQQQAANEEKIRTMTVTYDEKVKSLERTNKIQEEELIRVHHQERLKTREIDGLQQKINDLNASNSSLENSKGWFERALRDAEKVLEDTKNSHTEAVDELKSEHDEELEKARLVVLAKDDDIAAVEQRLNDTKDVIAKKDSAIERLKCDIKDEVQKQKLVEKKVHSTLKDLKKQLVSERKKNELLQEKLKEQSSGKSNLDELLTVVNTSNQSKPSSGGADGTSSVSSFSFRDLINPGRTSLGGYERQTSPSHQRMSTGSPTSHSTQLTTDEQSDLLSRITDLQNEKWALEEKVRHLEESGGAMADELVEKTELVQRYVQHTRTDSVKRSQHDDSLTPKSLRDKVRLFVTGADESSVGIGNIHELNKKLTRMLEEEMTKNMALKKDMEVLAERLAPR